MNFFLDNMDTSSLGKEELQDLRNIKPTVESISGYINKYHTDYPDNKKEIAGNLIEEEFMKLYLDEQIFILKEIIMNNPNALRAMKLIGLRYFWSLNNKFVDPAIRLLKKYTDHDKSENHNAVNEILGGLYLIKNDTNTAEKYFRMSTRFDVNFVIQTYGSFQAFSNQQRVVNKGLRFKDYSSGKYTIQDLIL